MHRIVLLFALFWSMASFSWGRELIIVGIPEEPNRWMKDGQAVGLDVDIIDHVMKKLGIPYKVQLVDSSARLEVDSKASPAVCDMVFTYSYNDERAKYLHYPRESHINFNWNFFYLKEHEGRYVFNSYKDLAKWTIGITKGVSYSDELMKAIQEVPLKVDESVIHEKQLDKLLLKRFDLTPLNTKATLFEARKMGVLDKIAYLPKPIKDKAYFNTFVKASTYPQLMEISAKYDEVLRQMKKDGTLAKIYANYGIR